MANECKERVGKGIVTFPCTLETGHTGPHFAQENQPSVRERTEWENNLKAAEANPSLSLPHPAAEPLAVFQGKPKTSQEGLVEHGAPMATIDTSAPGQGRTVYSASSREWPTAPQVEELKTREGDQPLPTVHEGEPYVADLVIQDIEERKQVGIQRYGTPLQAFNGRDVTLDAYEEALDLATYLRQLRLERGQLFLAVQRLGMALEDVIGSPLPTKFSEPLDQLYYGLFTELSE